MEIAFLSRGCILLLNGWTPMSVYNRTLHAEVVVSGYVQETYKDQRSKDLTYSAKIEILTVYKGQHLVDNLTSVDRNTFVISNFGDKKMCYADISEDEIYILFLTVYKQRLSAKYDDIFGAATELTKLKEEEILTQLGRRYFFICGQIPISPNKARTQFCSRILRHATRSLMWYSLAIKHCTFCLIVCGKMFVPSRNSSIFWPEVKQPLSQLSWYQTELLLTLSTVSCRFSSLCVRAQANRYTVLCLC